MREAHSENAFNLTQLEVQGLDRLSDEANALPKGKYALIANMPPLVDQYKVQLDQCEI